MYKELTLINSNNEKMFFNVLTSTKKRSYIKDRALNGYKDIYEIFKKPSFYKTRAFRILENWFNKCDKVYNKGCISGNCQTFTYGAHFRATTIDGELLNCYAFITRDYNYLVVEE